MRTINHSNYEEWIFEYYEGTLNTEEKALVLDFVQKDTVYKEEFESYSKTYLHEPLPAKLSIEDSLLRPEGLINFRYVISTLVIVISSGIFWITPSGKDFYEGSFKPFKAKESLVTESKDERFDNASIVNNKKQKASVKHPFVKEDATKADSSYTSFNLTPVEIRPLEALINKDSLSPKEGIVVGVKNIGTEFLKAKKEMTRKERKDHKRKARHLEALKEKQKRLRNAEKLMNGDQPYVVPLDPNIF